MRIQEMNRKIYPMNLHEFITSILEGDKTKIDIILGGIAGAIVRLAHEKNRNTKQAFVALATGGMCAHYFTPLIQHWTQLEYYGSIAFFSGLIGMKVVDFIFDFLSWIDNHPDKALQLMGKIPLIGHYFKKDDK